MTTVFDLAIVGGEIFGCLAGDEAARRHPEWRVLLLDRCAPAAGATGWSLAADIPFGLSPAHHRLIAESERQWGRLAGSRAAGLVRRLPILYVVGRDRLPALQEQLGRRRLRQADAAEFEPVRRMLPDVTIREHEILVTHDEPGAVLPPREFVAELIGSGPMAANTSLRSDRCVAAGAWRPCARA
ncbi:FAD-dependent oxidoreductase [Nonomuraea jabiensis]|uniref:FAD-dependent oxidoreductase n=1 Tax=Nonomuraea jabiensis TaxID=882448 RepID=UPI003425D762